MNVSSAFNTGLAGFQDASAQLNNASARIASASMPEKNTAGGLQGDQTSGPDPISITTELINMKVAELQAKSSAKVISTADEMLGTLIDISV